MSLFRVEVIKAFDPPGHVNDGLTEADRQEWTQRISNSIDKELKGQETGEPLRQFFNGTVTAFEVNQKPVPITWSAFPNTLKDQFNEPRRWKEADSNREKQDEYLEWSVKRNKDEQIEFVTFTCEMPEYWEFLSEVKRDKLVSLYKTLNPDFSGVIQESDLMNGGRYNRKNKWNDGTDTGCIAHMTQTDNNITAAIEIAARATVLRKDPSGNPVTEKSKLIRCSDYGVATRESDPKIGGAINGLARDANSVSLANPLGVYIQYFNEQNFKLDVEGTGKNLISVPHGTFMWQRGNVDEQMGLRLQVKVPNGVVGTGPRNKGVQLNVSDIVDMSNKQKILYGAQFADHIQMVIKGVSLDIPKDQVAAPLPCRAVEARRNASAPRPKL